MRIKKKIEFYIDVVDDNNGLCSTKCGHCCRFNPTWFFCAKFQRTLKSTIIDDGTEEGSGPIIFRDIDCWAAETIKEENNVSRGN